MTGERTVDKVGGDSLLATFGAPVSMQDPESRAVATALEMQRMMRRLITFWKQRDAPTMEIGIGIHAGEVVSGNVGSRRRMEFTVIGDTVNVASRFCSLARPGQILISGAVADKVSGRFEVKSLGHRKLKGKSEEFEVWEVQEPSQNNDAIEED